jgi:hypothetical protein
VVLLATQGQLDLPGQLDRKVPPVTPAQLDNKAPKALKAHKEILALPV